MYLNLDDLFLPKNGSENLIVHLGDCDSNFHKKEWNELVRLWLFGAFFLCNIILNQVQCNKCTWFLTPEKIYCRTVQKHGGSKTIHVETRTIGKMRSHYFHDPAKFCTENSCRIHHCINPPVIIICCSIEGTWNTFLIFFEKQWSSRIIIPEAFLVFGYYSIQWKSAYSHICNINCCIITQRESCFTTVSSFFNS